MDLVLFKIIKISFCALLPDLIFDHVLLQIKLQIHTKFKSECRRRLCPLELRDYQMIMPSRQRMTQGFFLNH